MAQRGDHVAWVRALAAQSVLERVLSAFSNAGIPALPVKGIVTARLLYEDAVERPMRDIDIRVARRDLRAVIHLARARGWTTRLNSPRLHETVLEVDGWEIDIECTLGVPGLCAITVERLIQRATLVVRPFAHLEPELHDHALILALNAFKDGLRAAQWAVEDLRRIVRREPFRASALAARAREGRVLSALWIVADWLSETHGMTEWRAIREFVGPRPPSGRVEHIYGAMLARGWPRRLGLLAAATSSDDSVRSALGLLHALAGVVRRRVSMVDSRWGRASDRWRT